MIHQLGPLILTTVTFEIKRQMVPPAGHTIALQKIPTISKNDSNDVFKKKIGFFATR